MNASKTVIRLAAVAAVTALVWTASSSGAVRAGSGASTQQAKAGGTLTLALNAGWDVLDPAATSFTFARQIMQFIYDPLLRRDPKTGKIVPGIAQSYKFTNGSKTLTITLRKGVTFQDGTPCNAQAVAFSFNRIVDPALHSPWAATLSSAVTSVTAKGSRTVVFQMKTRFAPILDTLTQVSFAPVSPTAVQKYGKDFGAHPVGAGPFMFDSSRPNDFVNLVRYPQYKWAPAFYKRNGAAYLAKVVVRDIPEDATRMALEQSGQIDVVYQPIISQLSQYRAPAYQVVRATRPGMPRSLVLNTTRFPFDDVRVRRAVAYAINKPQIVDTAYGGIGSPANDVITPNLFGYSAKVAKAWPKYNPTKAKQLLAQAGFTAGSGGILQKGGQKLEFTYASIASTSGNIQDQIIQSNLKAVGMQMNIRNEEQAAVLADLQACKWEMSNQLFVGTDPDVMYQFLQSASIHRSFNSACYHSPKMDRYLGYGRTTTAPGPRANLYAKAQQLALTDMPYVPFYDIQNAYIVNGRVHGFSVDTQAFWDIYNAWVSS